MILRTDDQGRMTCPELFRPNSIFEAERQSNGAILLIEKGAEARLVSLVKSADGHLMLPVELDSELIASAIRAERDSR